MNMTLSRGSRTTDICLQYITLTLCCCRYPAQWTKLNCTIGLYHKYTTAGLYIYRLYVAHYGKVLQCKMPTLRKIVIFFWVDCNRNIIICSVSIRPVISFMVHASRLTHSSKTKNQLITKISRISERNRTCQYSSKDVVATNTKLKYKPAVCNTF